MYMKQNIEKQNREKLEGNLREPRSTSIRVDVYFMNFGKKMFYR